MRQLDLTTLPLDGTILIEASAGTGKTFTLAGIYLRLVVEQGMGVDRILVVTFTVAATEELKNRIRERLRQALETFAGNREPRDALLEHLLETVGPDSALAHLHRALRDFDQAAIFTIHGFCQRTLADNAFESGAAFENEFVAEQQDLVREVAEDFWRQRFHDMSPTLSAFLMDRAFSPQTLVHLAGLCLNRPMLEVEPRIVTAGEDTAEQAFLEAFEAARSQWRRSSQEISSILLQDPALNRNSYRVDTVRSLLLKLEALFELAHPSPCLFDGFDRFTSSMLRSKTKKDHTPPTHPFFLRAQELADAAGALCTHYDDLLLAAKVAFVTRFEESLARRKMHSGVLSFDDLLRLMHRAVTGPMGARLAAAVRDRYLTALVDEFQDTDLLQYDIFSRFFDTSGHGLFLIGDPKQAIYSFRGADIFAYRQAVDQVAPENRFTLKTNYRSAPELVEAVNVLFSRPENPFVFPWIGFTPVTTPEDKPATGHGALCSELQIWLLDAQTLAPGKPAISRETAEHVAARATAGEISRLVFDHTFSEGREGAGPGDMAVLTRNHRQAQLVRSQLNRLHIPCVLYNSGNLFDTSEAVEVHRLMQAVAGFSSLTRLRTGLSTSLIGLNPGDLLALEAEPGILDQWTSRFADYHEQWRRQGFLNCFSSLLHGQGVQTRLLGLEQGERRLTNVLQLLELLHQQESDAHLGMEGLVSWLSRRLDPSTPRRDEHMLRLESDDEAVKIITVHKSKGLEFPVVFCPFLFESSQVGTEYAVCHESDPERRLVLDLGSEYLKDRLEQARLEELAENMRLLYVALTRARTRCYALWGLVNMAETAAAAHLLHHPSYRSAPPDIGLADRMKTLGQSGLEAEVQDLSTQTSAIRVCSPPESGRPFTPPPPVPVSSLASRLLTRTITDDWRISSFSHVVSGASGEDQPWSDELFSPPAADSTEEPRGMFAFPKGARAGVLLHDILERTDFMDHGSRSMQDLITDRLQAHGFEARWTGTILAMIQDLRQVSLDGKDLRLSDIPRSEMLHELEFAFPLNRLTPTTLADLFQGRRMGSSRLDSALHNLNFTPHQGFMKGYIDLVFRHRERYYLLDWKSNYLGSDPADYRRERLVRAMIADHYLLQYHLYTLALHAYLRSRLSGYDYDLHFGGVFYIFLRGIDPGLGPVSGVFQDRPARNLVGDMEQALMRPAHPTEAGKAHGAPS